MRLKFDANLEYQRDAVAAVVDVFLGQGRANNKFETTYTLPTGLTQTISGLGNTLTLSDEELLANVHKIQERNNIFKTPELKGREFSVEMETGTGKTYIYLRTIMELSRRYGWRKFIIVTPSIAVREGVKKNLEITRKHFETLYGREEFLSSVYSSERLGQVRSFANTTNICVLIINIQAFINDKKNVINRENDRMSGRRPIEYIQSTRPIVILDEPQSIDNTEKAQQAIRSLTPLVTLRYSATHRNSYNLLYKLDPVRAYALKLVKRIEVLAIRSDNNFNEAYVKLLALDNKKELRARLEIHCQKHNTVKPLRLWVKLQDRLYEKSGRRSLYENYVLHELTMRPEFEGEYIRFANDVKVHLGETRGGYDDAVMRAQLKETISEHLKKELRLHSKGIKVLSLFFIDKVENYRYYDEHGDRHIGKFGKWFEEEYAALTKLPKYRKLAVTDINKLHDGYFSIDNKGRERNSTGEGKVDESTYNKIMRNKEQLLSLSEPLKFIFTHSALREGWDNPNIFQICTLNESSHSKLKKRQELGRGLRLAVNQKGERIHDESINRLTVISNDTYEDFARTLQLEINADYGIEFGIVTKELLMERLNLNSDVAEAAFLTLIGSQYISGDGRVLSKFKPHEAGFALQLPLEEMPLAPELLRVLQDFAPPLIQDARKRVNLTFNKQVYLSKDFKALWDKIKTKTRYHVTLDSAELTRLLIKQLTEKCASIREPIITRTQAALSQSYAGVSIKQKTGTTVIGSIVARQFINPLTYLQQQTHLTRKTLYDIIKQPACLAAYRRNPQAFLELAEQEIRTVLRQLIRNGIQYERFGNRYWEMQRIEEAVATGIVRYFDRLYEVKHKEKTIFDKIEWESGVEEQFAKDLDINERIKLFVKLPAWFKLATPLGSYNPDWAFVTKGNQKLYFVCETKSSTDPFAMREAENMKIDCGKKHFNTIGAKYEVVKKLSELNL